jgi:oxaloacetate decarboxylase alpha subunit
MDRIMAMPRTRELAAEPAMADLPELRKRIGADLSDEEFLLRATMPAEMIDAMKAKGPAPREYDPSTVALMNLLRDLLRRTDVDQLEIEKEDFRLELTAG